MPDFEPVAASGGSKSSIPALKILVVSAYDDEAYVIGLLWKQAWTAITSKTSPWRTYC